MVIKIYTILTMRLRKKYLGYLYAFIFFLGLFILLVFLLNPNQLIPLPYISLSPIVLFYSLLFITVLFLGTFVFTNIRRGILLASGVGLILLLRMFGYRSILYLILPVVIVLLVELFFRRNK